MKKYTLFSMVVLCIYLSGCAKYWYQEGKTFDECKQAYLECFNELSKRTDFSSPTVDYEIKYMNQCMQNKGYREASAKELPLEVRRQEPESSLHWRARGIAGTIEP